MKPKKVCVTYKKERVVLSDVLPYEVPIIFSNRYFYSFLVENQIRLSDCHISWKGRGDAAFKEIIRLLFGEFNPASQESVKLTMSPLRKAPFKFRIKHKEDDFRELSVIHPLSQLAVADFYERNKELILYHSNLSEFSIRKPVKVAKHYYHKDKTHERLFDENDHVGSPEVIHREYKYLKTYFAYKDYSNVYKFYESYRYHRAEKKYDKLLRFDISKCFDSIYTHSITWAIYGKEFVKQHFDDPNFIRTFPAQFDALMQSLNYSETNGIVIGPEFSRIFAELILQRIDNSVAKTLGAKGIFNRSDYEAFRYVDDYFVFYNDDEIKNQILKNYRLQLREFKLAISESKTSHHFKPLITDITIAKQKIRELIDKYYAGRNTFSNDSGKKERYVRPIDGTEFITKFKTIIKESGIEYKDVLNYTLSNIEIGTMRLVRRYDEVSEKRAIKEQYTNTILEILDFTFFLYSVSPRVNITIKLCRILSIIIFYFRRDDVADYDLRHLIFKKIFDESILVLKKNGTSKQISQIEALYLLIALSELGKGYWLDQKTLAQYLPIDENLNYFSIVVLLFYIKNKKRYIDIKSNLLTHILDRFKKLTVLERSRSAELAMLLFDLLSCPFVDDGFKGSLLSICGLNDLALQTAVIAERKYWFVKWTNFNFANELYAKRGLEVY